MNTKQVLYNALTAQLEVKKLEAEKYTTEVYDINLSNLKEEVLNYFTDKVKNFGTFSFNGSSILLEIGSSWYDRVEIKMDRYWSDDTKTTRDVKMEWNSGNVNSKNNEDRGHDYLNLIHAVYTNFEEITDKYSNNWYLVYLNIEKELNKAWEEHNSLKQALDKLSFEIKQDSADAMKKIGFEVKKFKDDIHLDWNYKDDDGRVYNILTRSKSIQMQYGRSQYDTTYVHGFKVLGKKGNKYNVEVYREGSPTRTYDVLEKKFHSFIEDASRWEHEEADKRAEKTKRDFEKLSKK
jgi:hypothetical protein